MLAGGIIYLEHDRVSLRTSLSHAVLFPLELVKTAHRGQVDSGNISNMGTTGNIGLPILPKLPVLPESFLGIKSFFKPTIVFQYQG